jgi:hypothetical protein
MSLGAPMVARSWHREMLPDFLWLAAMLGRRSAWRAAYEPLDVLDEFVPDGRRILDGRLSSFALVPEDQRAAAREALQRRAPNGLPSDLGHMFALYPTCPARWLYEDWLEGHEPDTQRGLEVARSLVAEHTDKFGVRETRLRMAAISRHVTHRRIRHPGGELMDMVPKYPGRLTESDQRTVESMIRAMWGALFGMEVDEDPSVLDWPREFWTRNRELAPCQVRDEYDRRVPMDATEDGPVDPEPLMHVAEIAKVLEELDGLGGELREAQRAAVPGPDDDEGVSVLLGLASRLYRLTHDLLERPSAWAPATAPLHIRAILDTRILSAWLVHRNDREMFAAYRAHGIGRLKLLREHILADLGDDLDDEARALVDDLDRRVNLEIDELWQSVNLGSFTNKTMRDMAIEVGLKRDYDLVYAPYSSVNHAEWPSVRENDTLMCREPLHGGHRLGAFMPSSRTLGPIAPMTAFQYARDGIAAIFHHLGMEVEDKFEPLERALRTAVYTDADGDGDEPESA